MGTSTVVLTETNDGAIREAFFAFLNKSHLTRTEQLDVMMELSLGDNFHAVIDRLVRTERLTTYQAKEILAGRATSLIIGPHVVFDELGTGGFGRVFKAYHQLMGRFLALKIINPKLADDPDIRELFLREVIAGTRLAHPNLATAFNANDEDGVLYYAMEFIEGPDIESWLEQHGPLPIGYTIQLLLQAASALQFLHKHGMVHRDIKPANILLVGANLARGSLPEITDPETTLVKIIDFGLARLFPRGTPNSGTIRQEAELVGTPRFIAPEQATDFHDVDIRADLYSLGCTFYRALTGHYAFDADSTMQIIRMHMQEVALPLELHRPEVPPGLTAIIQKLMAKKVADRYATPNDLIAALNQLLQTMAYTAIQKPLSTIRMAPPPAFTSEPPQVEPETLAPMPATLTDSELRRAWDRWLALLNAIQTQQPLLLTAASYEELQRTLRHTLQQRADPLASLIQPWVTLRSLTTLDRSSLAELRQACVTQGALLSSPPTTQWWRSGLVTVVVIVVLTGLAYGLWRTPPFQERVRELTRSVLKK